MTRIVIMGGGPAGYEAALVAVQHGADVTVVERDGMGGACVLDDCVPSKTFIASAGVRVELRRGAELGVQVDRQAVPVDLPSVNNRVRNLALAQSADVRARLEREGIRIIRGTSRFAKQTAGGTYTVKVGPDVKDNAGRTPMTFAEGIFLAVRPPVAKPEAMALLKKLMGTEVATQ